jgi:simple sugar transport system permease protein
MSARAGHALLRAVLPVVVATLLALAVASSLIRIAGAAPLEVYRLLLAGTWGNAYGIGQVLFKATPLLFSGLSVAMGLRAGLFNVGAEGQIILGAFAAGWVGQALGPGWPAWLALPLCLVAAFSAGALCGGLAGLMKAQLGAHEVLTTIMLNFLVRAAMVGAGAVVFVRESIHTRPIVAAAALPRLSAWLPRLSGSAVNGAILVAVAAALACAFLLRRTRTGFRLQAVGASPAAAATAGVWVGGMTVFALALAGGLAGLGGVNFVLGYKHYYEDGFSGGVGFMGIAVAVLGRAHPLGAVAAAIGLGTLSQGALAINALVPKELVDVLVAVVIFSVVAVVPAARRAVEGPR